MAGSGQLAAASWGTMPSEVLGRRRRPVCGRQLVKLRVDFFLWSPEPRTGSFKLERNVEQKIGGRGFWWCQEHLEGWMVKSGRPA